MRYTPGLPVDVAAPDGVAAVFVGVGGAVFWVESVPALASTSVAFTSVSKKVSKGTL